MVIRNEQPADIPGIRKVLEAAFPQSLEANLVDQLRAAGDIAMSLVSVEKGEIVGQVLYSKLSAPFKALGLGPVAVLPEKQGFGIGSQLIREGLTRATQAGWQGIFVLGDPGYYQRFGFDPSLASGFTSPYAGPHWMLLSLNGAVSVWQGKVDYAPAFAALG